MTRRPTPLLVNDSRPDPTAVPQAVERDDRHGIMLARPTPTAFLPPTGEPAIVWVHDRLRAADAPAGATACSVDEAMQWAAQGPPPWLRSRRVDGVLVQSDPAATSVVRRAARALRERVTPRDPAGLRDVAVAWGNPGLVDALARLEGDRTPTFADLARALSRANDPESTRLARLCWALEHL